MNDGKNFELLTQKIQQELSPDAKVTHNETIEGKSGAKNQIDVVLRAKVGQYPFLCIIECKDWAEKVGLDTVRAFKSKIIDVGAMQGVMVSRSGYTKDAMTFAKSENVILYTLVDAETQDWSKASLVPMALIRIELDNAAVELHSIDGKQSYPLQDQQGNIHSIYDFKAKKWLHFKSFVEGQWDRVFKDREPAPDEWFQTQPEEYYIKLENSKLTPVVIKYSMRARKWWYYGYLPLKRCLGLLDQKDGQFLSVEYDTHDISIKEIISKWTRVDKEEDVPFQPEHTLLMGHFFTKTQNSGDNSKVDFIFGIKKNSRADTAEKP